MNGNIDGASVIMNKQMSQNNIQTETNEQDLVVA
jgi:hypothetical protein